MLVHSESAVPSKRTAPVWLGAGPEDWGAWQKGAQPGSLHIILTPCPRGGSRWSAAPPTLEASLFRPCLLRPSFQLCKGPRPLRKSPSNAVVPWAPPRQFANRAAAAPKYRLREFTSLWCLSWCTWPSPCPFLNLCSVSRTLSCCSCIYKCCSCPLDLSLHRLGDGVSFKVQKEAPIRSILSRQSPEIRRGAGMDRLGCRTTSD